MNNSTVKDGNRYVPYEERTGNESIVYFTRDLSPEGLMKVYDRVKDTICGKVAIKLHTGEPNGPNIIPPAWIKVFMENETPDATIIETNTFMIATDKLPNSTGKHWRSMDGRSSQLLI